jgi:hypothetical protein
LASGKVEAMEAHRKRGSTVRCNCSHNGDVSGGIDELQWRAAVVNGTYRTGEPRGSDMRWKDRRKIGERWSSAKGGNGGGVAAKPDGVGGALVSQRGREIEEGGVLVCSSLDGRKLVWGRKGAMTALDASKSGCGGVEQWGGPAWGTAWRGKGGGR